MTAANFHLRSTADAFSHLNCKMKHLLLCLFGWTTSIKPFAVSFQRVSLPLFLVLFPVIVNLVCVKALTSSQQADNSIMQCNKRSLAEVEGETWLTNMQVISCAVFIWSAFLMPSFIVYGKVWWKKPWKSLNIESKLCGIGTGSKRSSELLISSAALSSLPTALD